MRLIISLCEICIKILSLHFRYIEQGVLSAMAQELATWHVQSNLYEFVKLARNGPWTMPT